MGWSLDPGDHSLLLGETGPVRLCPFSYTVTPGSGSMMSSYKTANYYYFIDCVRSSQLTNGGRVGSRGTRWLSTLLIPPSVFPGLWVCGLEVECFGGSLFLNEGFVFTCPVERLPFIGWLGNDSLLWTVTTGFMLLNRKRKLVFFYHNDNLWALKLSYPKCNDNCESEQKNSVIVLHVQFMYMYMYTNNNYQETLVMGTFVSLAVSSLWPYQIDQSGLENACEEFSVLGLDPHSLVVGYWWKQ